MRRARPRSGPGLQAARRSGPRTIVTRRGEGGDGIILPGYEIFINAAQLAAGPRLVSYCFAGRPPRGPTPEILSSIFLLTCRPIQCKTTGTQSSSRRSAPGDRERKMDLPHVRKRNYVL